MTKISVIVPIYNVEKYLDVCINSIVHQTYKDLEILLINDGSPDSSHQICQKWSQSDSRIIYIEQKNQGVSVARNRGIVEATGSYITFVDGDDYLEPEMIEKLYLNIQEVKTKIACCGYFADTSKGRAAVHYFNESKILAFSKNIKMFLEKIITDLGVPWGKLYETNFVRQQKLQFKVGLKRMQDTIFNLDAFCLAEMISFIPEPLYGYRIFNESATNKYSPHFDLIAQDVLKYFKEFLMKRNLWEEYSGLYYSKMLILLIETIKLKYIPDESLLTVSEKKKAIRQEVTNFNLDFNLVNIPFLDKNNKIGYYLLRWNMISIFYFVYRTNYRRKKKRNYK